MPAFRKRVRQTLDGLLSPLSLKLSSLSAHDQLFRGYQRFKEDSHNLQKSNANLQNEVESLRQIAHHLQSEVKNLNEVNAVSRNAIESLSKANVPLQAEAEKLDKASKFPENQTNYIFKVLQEDHNLIHEIFRSLDSSSLAILVEKVARISEHVILIGEGEEADHVATVLHEMGRQIQRVAVPPEELPANEDVIFATSAFSTDHYESIATLRRSSNAKVYTLFQLFGTACLFKAVEWLIGYHIQPAEKMLAYAAGAKTMTPLTRLNERYPLQGKRVIEFGPLDGAMTGNLIALGVASLCCVEIRMVNVLKVLAARQYLGWENMDLVIDDMHTVDERTYGRFDLVVAHGVYYHSLAPFRFLKNLTSLADTIYLGGFCANPSRLRNPLVILEHEGHAYRAQPFSEVLDNSGAGAHPSGYYFLPEDLLAFFERLGFTTEVIDLDESLPNKQAGFYLRALIRREV